MRCFPKSGFWVFLLGGFIFLSCGHDDSRFYRSMMTYTPTYTPYVSTAPYVMPPRYVPIVTRSYPYRYVYGYSNYSRWPSYGALSSYLDCRTYGYVRYVTWRTYRCVFPYRYRHYEYVSRYLDGAMEEFYFGRRQNGGGYLSQAMGVLPPGDPMAGRLEDLQALAKNGDVEEIQTSTMELLGDVAMKMAPEESKQDKLQASNNLREDQ
jgi:hypothetical protein